MVQQSPQGLQSWTFPSARPCLWLLIVLATCAATDPLPQPPPPSPKSHPGDDARAVTAAVQSLADPHTAAADIKRSVEQLRHFLLRDDPYAQALREMADQIQRVRSQASRRQQAAVESRRHVQLQLAELDRRVRLLESRGTAEDPPQHGPGANLSGDAASEVGLQARIGATEDGLAQVSAQGRAVARSNSRLKSRIEHVEWLQNQTR